MSLSLEIQIKNKINNNNILLVTENGNIVKDYYVGFVDELKDIASEYYPGVKPSVTEIEDDGEWEMMHYGR